MRYFGTDANGLETYRRTLRAALAWISRAPADCKQASNGAWTFTGSWSATTVNGLDTKYSSTSGDTASISATGTAVTLAYVSHFGLGDGGTFSVKIDGVTVASSVDTDFGSSSGFGSGSPTRYVPMALRFAGLSAGSHTVLITLTSSAVVQVAFVTGSGEATAPEVRVGGPLKMNSTGYSSNSPYNNGTDAVVATYTATIKTLLRDGIADGRLMKWADVNSFYTPADVSGDNVHPDNAGHVDIENAFLAASACNAYPLFPGIQFRGGNLVPRPTDTGNGLNGVPADFYDLLYDWGTGDVSDPWNNWIKPQIDALASVGGNLLRFIFDITVRLGDSSHHGAATFRGTITSGQLHTILNQLITYLASKGMYLYGTATESRPLLDSGISNGAAINAYITDYVATISSSSYTNVVGVDVVNEWDYDGTSGNLIADNLASLVSVAKAARDRLIPVTCSYNGAANSTDVATIVSRLGLGVTAGFDFFDAHMYYQMAASDLDGLFGNSQGLAVVINETGIPYTGYFSTANADGSSAANRDAMYDAIVAMALRDLPQSCSVWSIAPNYIGNRSNDYGFFDETFTARADLTSRVQLIPASPLVSPVATVGWRSV